MLGIHDHRNRRDAGHRDSENRPIGIRHGHEDGPVHWCAAHPIGGRPAGGRDNNGGDDCSAGKLSVAEHILERVFGGRTGSGECHPCPKCEEAREQFALGISSPDCPSDGRHVAKRARSFTACEVAQHGRDESGVGEILKARCCSDADRVTLHIDPGEVKSLKIHGGRGCTIRGGVHRRSAGKHNSVRPGDEGNRVVKRERPVVLRDHVHISFVCPSLHSTDARGAGIASDDPTGLGTF